MSSTRTSLPNSLERLAYQYKLERAKAKTAATADPSWSRLSFAESCARHLVIQNKAGQLSPLILNRAQRELTDSLTSRDLVLKARQVGISTAVQARFFWFAMRGGARTSTLCHDDDLTQDLRAMADRFYGNLPDHERPEREYANAKLTTYPVLNSQCRIATVGGQAGPRKGRGGTSTAVLGSEVAFWPDAEGVMAAAMQAGDPEIILESTPNGAQGWFYERCMEALDGNSIWRLHFFPWWYEAAYQLPLDSGGELTYTEDEARLIEAHNLTAEQILWRRNKQAELPHTFAQEYPEDPLSCFLVSGGSYFGDVEGFFTAPEGATPQAGHEYFGGLDFAQTNDYLVLFIIDATTMQQVDILRVNQLSWQEMRRRVSVMANYWHAPVLAEGNSMGTTNIELLKAGETLGDGTVIEPVRLKVFDTSGTTKPPLIQGYYHALHEAGLRLLNRPVLKAELRAFISKQNANGHWIYEAKTGHDDTVIAGALTYRRMMVRGGFVG